MGGWDGGSHVAFRRKFVSSNPAEYHGFVSLYSLTYWLERILATDAFRSFEIAYYINTATYAILPVTLALVLVRKHEGRWGTVLGTGAILGASLFFLSKIGLPLFHYNQAAAFYSHLFVIVPMAILWGADALTLKEPLRILGILFALGACRYTYGLNFPDALLAAALVVAMPSRRVQNYWIHALFVVALIGAAIAGYIALAPRFEIFGGMTIFQLDLAVAAHVGGVVVAATYILLRHHAAAGIPDPSLARLIRFVRFPLIFALVSTVAFSIYRGGEPKQDYYLAKYQFTTALLLAAVYVVIATDAALVIARLLHSRPLRRQAAAWLSLLVAGVLLVGSGKLAAKTFQIYRKGYNERVNQTKPPFTLLTALVDVEAMARIKSILAAKKSRFGGYLTTYFPRFNFMNATLNHHSGVQEFFAPDPTPGRCVFWVAPEHDIEMGGSVAVLQKHRDQIIAEGGSTCATYSVRWKATPQSLCHRCF